MKKKKSLIAPLAFGLAASMVCTPVAAQTVALSPLRDGQAEGTEIYTLGRSDPTPPDPTPPDPTPPVTETVAAPSIQAKDGAGNSPAEFAPDARVTVTLNTATPGAEVYYSVGSGAEALYTGPFTVTNPGSHRDDNTLSISARAVKTGMHDSTATTRTLYFRAEAQERAASPEIRSWDEGGSSRSRYPYDERVTVRITSDTRDADIYYRIDGGSEKLYTGSFIVRSPDRDGGTVTVSARAESSGLDPSYTSEYNVRFSERPDRDDWYDRYDRDDRYTYRYSRSSSAASSANRTVLTASNILSALTDSGSASRVRNATSISPEAARKVPSGKLYADTVRNNAVTGRLTLDPQQINDTVRLDMTVGYTPVENLFKKHFGFNLTAVRFGQSGSFGQEASVAVQLDGTGLDRDNLVFYQYNTATNRYSKLDSKQYSIDRNGYVHFRTTQGGCILIADREI